MIKKLTMMIFGFVLLMSVMSINCHAQVSNGHLSVKIGGRYGVNEPVTLKGNGNLVIKDLKTGQIIHDFQVDELKLVAGVEKANVGGYAWIEENREELITTNHNAIVPVETPKNNISEGEKQVLELFGENSQGTVATTGTIKGISQRYILEPNVDKPIIKINDKAYHGGLYFINIEQKVTIVNRVLLEDYLKGVVPREIGPSSPHEALKAQAVAARSFALSNIDKYRTRGYQLNDTPNSQVYVGIGGEAESCNKAIQETRGIVGYYDGKVASLIFGASSGGLTESAKLVWGGDIPYLGVVDDPYSLDQPYANWEVKLPLSEFSQKLAGSEYDVGAVNGIQILETTPQHRVKKLSIAGSNGTKEISGAAFRARIGDFKVMSTWFTTRIEGDELIINGHGFGHGVGMSQHGAIAMAKQGLGARDILKHYYPLVSIE